MKRFWVIVLIIPILFLLGCASIQTSIFKFDDTNAATTLAGAKQIVKHGDMNIKFLRTVIGSGMDKLPVAFNDNLKSLEVMVVKYRADQSQMTEGDAGLIMGYGSNLLLPSIQTIMQQYWPDVWAQVLKWIPTFLPVAM